MTFILKEKQQAMKKAAEEFATGSKIEDVMKKYNVSYASIYNALKRYNIQYKYTYGRTIFFNENYFETIDTEEKAYWLGFLFADGCIELSDKKCSTHNRLSIGLSVKDLTQLERFAKAIEMPVEQIRHIFPKHSYSCSEMVYLSCNSIKMCNDLKALNCTPQKSLHSVFPPIKQEYQRHFIRGYFDGDGCISRSFEITSDGHMLHQIQQILMSACDLKATQIRYRKHSYNLRYGGKLQLERIFHYLYDNATIYMQRKYDKFHSTVFTVS